MHAMQNFRSSLLSFRRAANRVSSFYDGDTDIDILMRVVENLREDVSEMKENQMQVYGNMAKVVNFIEKFDTKLEKEEKGAGPMTKASTNSLIHSLHSIRRDSHSSLKSSNLLKSSLTMRSSLTIADRDF